MKTYETGNADNKIYVSFSMTNVINLFPLRTFVVLEYKLSDDLHKTIVTSSKDMTIDIPQTLVGTEPYHRKGTLVFESHIGYADGLEEALKLLRVEYTISGGQQGKVVYRSFDKKVIIKSTRGNKVILLQIIDLI